MLNKESLRLGLDCATQGSVAVFHQHIGAVPSCTMAYLEGTLDDVEDARRQAYRNTERALAFTLARGFARVFAGAWLGIEPRSILLRTSEYGRPELQVGNDSPLSFNVSYSHGMVVWAFTACPDVGIDVERIRAIEDLDDLIAGTLSERERALVLCEDDTQVRASKFLEFWVAKEAVLKALGVGLNASLPDICVAETVRTPGRYAIMPVGMRTMLASLPTPHQYVFAIAHPCVGFRSSFGAGAAASPQINSAGGGETRLHVFPVI